MIALVHLDQRSQQTRVVVHPEVETQVDMDRLDEPVCIQHVRGYVIVNVLRLPLFYKVPQNGIVDFSDKGRHQIVYRPFPEVVLALLETQFHIDNVVEPQEISSFLGPFSDVQPEILIANIHQQGKHLPFEPDDVIDHIIRIFGFSKIVHLLLLFFELVRKEVVALDYQGSQLFVLQIVRIPGQGGLALILHSE